MGDEHENDSEKISLLDSGKKSKESLVSIGPVVTIEDEKQQEEEERLHSQQLEEGSQLSDGASKAEDDGSKASLSQRSKPGSKINQFFQDYYKDQSQASQGSYGK